MTIDELAPPGERVAVVGADPRFESELRQACGLRGPFAVAEPPNQIGYCGFDFRSYGWMSVGDAAAYFGHLAPVNEALLHQYLALAGLEEAHDTQRLKTAYQRSLVLAIQASLEPGTLIVERAGQFDEERPAALLREAVGRAPRAIVCYEGDGIHDGVFTRSVDRRPPAAVA